ncbi:putative transmembrane protein [Helianthus annuus]|nr:putative transmembrane protein [Helianthus annuus]KAJ0864372.1 putative transmembrane protein [Helianthus annuus]
MRTVWLFLTSLCLSLILLILFTILAIVGCVILYTGQGKFYHSTTKTLDYVVSQANTTAQNLRNLSDVLASAKKIGVAQVFLPVQVQSTLMRFRQSSTHHLIPFLIQPKIIKMTYNGS